VGDGAWLHLLVLAVIVAALVVAIYLSAQP
jgi:hypothetical protein